MVKGAGFAASEDHRAEAAVADGKSVDPLGRGFVIPESKVVGGNWPIESTGETCGEGKISEEGGGCAEEPAAGETAHRSDDLSGQQMDSFTLADVDGVAHKGCRTCPAGQRDVSWKTG